MTCRLLGDANCTANGDCCNNLLCAPVGGSGRRCCASAGTQCALPPAGDAGVGDAGVGANPCCGNMACAPSGAAAGSYCLCRVSNEVCSSNADCCPGLVCNAGRCANATTACYGPGDTRACTDERQCCTGLRCSILRRTLRCCTGAGSACRTSAECCGQMLCAGGRCACQREALACDQNGDCCSGNCVSGRCAAM